jgi:DNA-binding response OmpR family regulator
MRHKKINILIRIIILDQFMPGLDGVSTLREIKKNNSGVPVII